MDQLVVLQEIYSSFSKGGDGLQNINSRAIGGSCPDLMNTLLDSSKKGRIDEDVCQKLADRLQDVYEIKRLGDICRKAGLYGLAIKCYNKALSLSGDRILRPVLLNNLGQTYARQGDLARAAVYYRKAANGFEDVGDRSGLAHVLGNLGSAYRLGKDWDRAIKHCYRSLKIFEEKGDDQGMAQMNGSLGRIYAEMGERELAARFFEISLKDFQKLGDKKSAAWVLDRLGRIAAQRKDWDKALGCFNQSLSLFNEQGLCQSAGIVLSDLGRTYLDMGEATAARESLERAVRLLPRGTHPAYQNALSSLAATYSALGRDCLQQAEDAGAENVASDRSAKVASKYYARASDRYLELASSLKVDLPELKVAAGIARCRSYLAKLSGDVSDEEAVALAERALAALDIAAANSEGRTKAEIEKLKRTLAGMKGAWSLGLLGDEPWRLTKAVTNSAQYLMGGACASGEANGCLCDALRNLSASIEAKRNRGDPGEKLMAAAADLRRAEKRFIVMERDPGLQSAEEIGEAAKIIEELASTENGPGQAKSASIHKDHLSFKPERDTLLLIGRVLARNTLSELDDADAIYTWDESLNLVKKSDEGKASRHLETDGLEAEPLPAPIPETDRPVLEVSKDRAEAQEMILADHAAEASEILVSEVESAKDGWLVPVKASIACESHGQIQLYPQKPLTKVVEIVKPKTGEESIPRQELSDDANLLGGASEDTDSAFGEPFQDPARAWEDQAKEGRFNQANAIKLLKALALVVTMLLAVEAILYLI
jgi:tetratricopeptide (TPR) repeat protein